MKVVVPWRLEDDEYADFSRAGRDDLLAHQRAPTPKAGRRAPLAGGQHSSHSATASSAPKPASINSAHARVCGTDWRGGSDWKEKVFSPRGEAGGGLDSGELDESTACCIESVGLCM